MLRYLSCSVIIFSFLKVLQLALTQEQKVTTHTFSPVCVELLVLDLLTLISVIQAFLDLGELLISSDAAAALDALKTVRFHYCSLLNRKCFLLN